MFLFTGKISTCWNGKGICYKHSTQITVDLHACSARTLRSFIVRHCLLCSHIGLIARELFQLHRGKFHRHPGIFKSFRTWLEQLHAPAWRKTLRPTSPTHAAETRSPFADFQSSWGTQHTANIKCTWSKRARAQPRQASAKSSADALQKLSVKLEVYWNISKPKQPLHVKTCAGIRRELNGQLLSHRHTQALHCRCNNERQRKRRGTE